MVRKLALAVSLALGTAQIPAHALGLGDISSNSNLNQNFRGEIALLSVNPDELDTVRVALADAAAFARAGVERPYFLSQLQFEPAVDQRGRPVIRVSSDFPIREPFMNFLVEVNWPNGRLLREYTVLLDPPTTTNRRPPQVAPVARSAVPAPAAAAAAPAPVRQAPVARPAAPAPSPASGPQQYGPVKANDTAWSIARQLRPDGVSMEQMMMALLRANPEAFLDNNINRLRRGQILRVPTVAEIQELSRQQARQAYREQQDAWLARRDARLQAENAPESQGSAEGTPAAGDTGAPPEGAGDRLRIAAAAPDAEGAAGAGAESGEAAPESLGTRLLMAREEAETSRQEAETLRSQVDDLQERLRDMQRLLSLKDDQLARLQDRMGQEPVVAADGGVGAGAGVPAAVATPVVEEVVPGNVVDLSEQAAAAAQPPAEAETVATAEVPPAPVEVREAAFEFIEDIPAQVDPDRIVLETMAPPVTQAPAPVAADPLPAPADLAPAAATALPPVGAAEPAAVVVAEPEIQPVAPAAPLLPPEVGEFLEQNMVPVAIGGVLVLALVGWLATRSRRREPDEEALLPAAAALPEAFPVDQPQAPQRVLDELPESGFLDDFSPSELNALQDETGEVDPVSEADVYIAYGRYQQAEELLGQAMQRDPGRLALKHKLLEVHYATRNGDKFAALAQEMSEAGQDAVDEDAWSRAQDMGRELQPDNPLFAAAEGGAERRKARHAGGAMLGGAAAMVDDDTLSLDELELSELKAAYEEAESQESQLDMPSEVSIMLDLDEASSLSSRPTAQVPEPIPFEEVESLDFTLPLAEQDDQRKHDADNDTINDAFDLDSMMAQAEAVVDGGDTSLSLDSAFSAEELQAQLDELSDLSALDSAFEQEVAAPEYAEPRSLGLVSEDRSDLPGGVDQPMHLDDALETEDLVGEGAEILQFEPMAAEPIADDADDVTTKLDLARAYYEMGDEDGARSILEEVVAEGNDNQRDDAERLLAKLG